MGSFFFVRGASLAIAVSALMTTVAVAQETSATAPTAPASTVAASPAPVASPVPAAPIAAAVPATPPAIRTADQIVCHEAPAPVGSRIGGGRECHTQHEWDERHYSDERMLQRMQSVPYKH